MENNPKPPRAVSLNQLVGRNMTYWRREAGLTQEELGQSLSAITGAPWSKASVSAAERSWAGIRVRRFDLEDIFAFADVLNVPFDAFLLPPDDGGEIVEDHIVVYTSDPDQALALSAYVEKLFPSISEMDMGSGGAYQRRLQRLLERYGADGKVVRKAEASTQDVLQRRRRQTFARLQTLGDLSAELRDELRHINAQLPAEVLAADAIPIMFDDELLFDFKDES